MSKRKKLLERIRRNPRNVSFEDLITLLNYYGFDLIRSKGSHRSFKGLVGGQAFLLTVPYKRPLQAIYVKQALSLVERVIAERELDEDEDDETDNE